ncbi:peptide-methionine (S)-S-oxide reductase [Lewinella marina]|uniref:Peptide methionine sulfoxide reductase MsrA n=1 Tax=Neolewinella marina TaxID=438751 RepID=A0A2G0CIN8_9BACT|nr:peptide-methionine (S)-S-oxide reductase MsrA [Neolewinella marina]NJB85008.1 peptide-methionine (S)-S-oxide reductase [Neolewinella marina]PHK99842.1 peptide-methionine (S)-S-oxide reductase [Neolewinella marina]
MNYLLLPFLLLFLSLTACDSQRNSAGTATSETTPAAETPSAVEDITIEELDARYPEAAKAYFAGGCFWCTEASFTRIQGVVDVYSGYAGGTAENPNYKQVSSGQTDYAEAIVVYYNPDEITYDKLLDIFFVAHDPTQVNRQGPDIGPQYRSAIFPLNEQQRQEAEAKIAKLNASGKFDEEIATTIESSENFYVAEAYHQNYYEDPTNPNQGYVQNVSRPKVEKVMKEFSDILKPEYR